MKVTEGTFTATTKTVPPPGAVAAVIVGFVVFAFIAGANPAPPRAAAPVGRVPAADTAAPPAAAAARSTVALSIVAGVALGVVFVAAAGFVALARWSQRRPPYLPDGNVHYLDAHRVREIGAGGGRKHPSLGNLKRVDREPRR